MLDRVERYHQQQLRIDDEYQMLVRPIEDIAREFGDEAPIRASVTRAYNLMHKAGVTTGDLVQLLSEAKALTRAYQPGIIKTRGDASVLPRKNLMPYFFATLDSLLNPDQQSPTQQEQQLRQDHTLQRRGHTRRKKGSARTPSTGIMAAIATGVPSTTSLESTVEHPVWRHVLDELRLVLIRKLLASQRSVERRPTE